MRAPGWMLKMWWVLHLSYLQVVGEDQGMVQTLLDKRARVDVSKNGVTSLSAAIATNNKEIFQLLLAKVAEVGRNSLFLAIHYNRPDMLQTLIDKGEEVDITNENGNLTPLQFAI